MLEGYANLSWSKTKIKDIVLLEKTTKQSFRDAKTLDEAKIIYDKFLAAFKDGHLELVKNNESPNQSESISFDSTSSADEVNEYLGNDRVITNNFFCQ